MKSGTLIVHDSATMKIKQKLSKSLAFQLLYVNSKVLFAIVLSNLCQDGK